MLGLQTRNLEQQERLFKNQIKLNIREIIQGELDFYNQAFQNISNSASILGGFAFSGLLLDPFGRDDVGNSVHDQFAWLTCESFFYFFCFAATIVSLLTLVFANFAGLFSVRLALRGGATSVEDTVERVRGEYNIALFGLVAAVELFMASIPFIGFYKLKWYNATVGCLICFPALFAVIFIYKRAEQKFHLDESVRFGSSQHNSSGNSATEGLSKMVQEIDNRNQPDKVPNHKRKPGGKSVVQSNQGESQNSLKIKENNISSKSSDGVEYKRSNSNKGEIEMMEEGEKTEAMRIGNKEKQANSVRNLSAPAKGSDSIGIQPESSLSSVTPSPLIKQPIPTSDIKNISTGNTSSVIRSTSTNKKTAPRKSVEFMNISESTSSITKASTSSLSSNSMYDSMVPEDYTGWGVSKNMADKAHKDGFTQHDSSNRYFRGGGASTSTGASSTLEVRESYFNESQYEDDAGFRRAEDNGKVDTLNNSSFNGSNALLNAAPSNERHISNDIHTSTKRTQSKDKVNSSEKKGFWFK